jgi:hypothetical protein
MINFYKKSESYKFKIAFQRVKNHLKSIKSVDLESQINVINHLSQLKKYIYDPKVDELNFKEHSLNFDTLDLVIIDGD